MDVAEVEALLLDRYGLRADPAMRAYVAERLADADAVPFPILAGDAWTGRPVRQLIAPAKMLAAANPAH